MPSTELAPNEVLHTGAYPDFAYADLATGGEMLVGQHNTQVKEVADINVHKEQDVPFTPSEKANTTTNMQDAIAESNTLPVTTYSRESVGTEMEKLNATNEQTLGLVLGHLSSMLVSSPVVDKSLPVQVDTEVVNACLDNQLAETTEVSQPQQDLDLTVETIVQGVPTKNQQLINNIDIHLPSPIDNFLDSISLPIMQPLLDGGPMTPMTNSTRAAIPNQHINPTPSANKRHRSRLAQKAEANSGKDAIQIAQDLLVKKLGELSGSVVQ